MEDNVILVSRYDEWSGDLVLIGIANCRYRAQYMVATDIEAQDVNKKFKVTQKIDVTIVEIEGSKTMLTYTLTEIPMNTVVSVPKF